MQMDVNNIAGGAMAEKINIELRKLAENVMDPNTKAEAVRTVTISIKIKPNETRQIGASEISVKSNLAPSKGIPTSFMFDYDNDGKAVMKELMTKDPNQLIVNNDGDVADATGKKVVTGKFR